MRGGGDIFGYRDTKWRLNMALLVQKFVEKFLLSKSVFGYFKTKFYGGGGKALVAGPLKKRPFFTASQRILFSYFWSFIVNHFQGAGTKIART